MPYEKSYASRAPITHSAYVNKGHGSSREVAGKKEHIVVNLQAER